MERKETGFIEKMNLSREEIATFEKYVDMMENAEKNGIKFMNDPSVLAFTPGALLFVAVAKFVYDVYQDYGAIAANPTDLQVNFKQIIKQLHVLENATEDAPSMDAYSAMRREIMSAKKNRK
jgi:hypothetical protein